MTLAAVVNATPAAVPPAAPPLLPVLREELLLHAAPRSHDGAPAWTLEDPGRGQFYQIGWAEAEMLARWHLADPARIAAAIGAETALRLDADDVTAFARFLEHSSLTQGRGAAARQRYLREQTARRGGNWTSEAIKHYLFFRIPLVRPDAFLAATLPWLRRTVLTRRFAQLTLAAGVLGLLLAARQWDRFLHTFLHFFTLEGAALAALTLGLTKLVHELGHAYAAKWHGCRVATMGVAFMVMWPVLYTDASGAWRLGSRRQRMAIGSAGMMAELALSAWATLAWSFLPDGMLRSAAFILATTTWLLTLAVNLNPLMRFDGYFLLSDALNVPNLQHRAFALGRWQLREWLFGLGDSRPEVFAPWRERALLTYAFCVWIYRFFLFLGIAVLVYHMAFKLLGIILFLIEIVTFVLKPIYTELQAWRARLSSTPGAAIPRRARITGAVVLALLILAAVPWRTRVEAPGLLRAGQQLQLVAPSGAQITGMTLAAGQQVRAGQPLLTLDAPELRQELTALEQRIRVLEWQLSFQAMDQSSMASAPVARRELDAAQQRFSLLSRQSRQLTMTAPFDATVADLAAPLAQGEWVAGGEWLATLAAPGHGLVEAYVSEQDLRRLRVGAHARFLAEDVTLPARAFTVVEIAPTASRRLGAGAELASPNGGAIAAVQEPSSAGGHDGHEGRAWVPEQAVYRIVLQPRAGTDPALARLQVLRGTVTIDGEAESLLLRAWRRIAAIAIRETGF